MYSMTNFISHKKEISINNITFNFSIDIKSINAKYIDVSFKMPSFLFEKEFYFYKKVKDKCIRGTIYIVYNIENTNEKIEQVYEKKLITSFDFLKKIAIKCNLENTITLNDIITFQDAFKEEKKISDKLDKDETFYAKSEEFLDDALTVFLNKSLEEGEAIKVKINAHINNIKNSFKLIKDTQYDIIEEKKKKLQEKLSSLISQIDNKTLENLLEIDIFRNLEKLDISEEIDRFDIHLKNLEKIINEPNQEIAKKVEFLLQELFREINTLGVKASDYKKIDSALSIKLDLEKIREQIQNVI